jgi:predicted dehydrogenase
MSAARIESRPLRVGIAGLGIAGVSHLFDAMSNPAVTVVGACARRTNRARELASTFGITVYCGLDELLDAQQPDAVIVATPPRYLTAHAMRALSTGGHVLLEKPAAATPADIERLSRASTNARPSSCRVGYTRRYKRGWHSVRALLAQGALGTVRHLRLAWRGPYRARFSTGAASYRSDAASRVAGVVLDTGCHMLDLCQFLFAPVAKVSFAEVVLSDEGVDVGAAWRAQLQDGIVVDASITDFEGSEHAEVSVTGSRGDLIIRESADCVAGSMTGHQFTESGYVSRPVDDLVELSMGGKTHGATLEDAMLTSAAVVSIYDAASVGLCRELPWISPRAKSWGRLSGAC